MRIPRATYRLQLGQELDFRKTSELVDYLEMLGVSEVYFSPILKAMPGSTHGYDVVDYGQLRPELGSWDDLEHLGEMLRRKGMGILLDIVPNHMGIARGMNRWWNDVLEFGPSSQHAAHFDVDWRAHKPGLENRVLIPVLGDMYGRVLESKQLSIHFVEGRFQARYFDLSFPMNPKSGVRLLEAALGSALVAELPESDHDRQELESILTGLRNLPQSTERDAAKIRERYRESGILAKRLFELTQRQERVAKGLESVLQKLNGQEGEPGSFDLFDEILEEQSYRLAHWRVAAYEVNYRRFFDINELAAVRMEVPEVFEAAHALPLELVAKGWVTGFRVDHPDGLFDPREYFERVQEGACRALAGDEQDEVAVSTAVAGLASVASTREVPVALQATGTHGVAAIALAPATATQPDLPLNVTSITRATSYAGSGNILPPPFRVNGDSRPGKAPSFYVVAEKILEAGEDLPRDWAVHGTTGYDFLNRLNGIFVDPTAERTFLQEYRKLGGANETNQLVYECKKLVLSAAMSSEWHRLANDLERLAISRRASRDFTRDSLMDALAEVIACFPVYRTYIREGDVAVSECDRAHILTALRHAKRATPTTNRAIYDFIGSILLLDDPADLSVEGRRERRRFVLRFQQLTGPVMAKGLEDTAFYRHFPLASLNEVGAEHHRFSQDLEGFHQSCQKAARHWPHTMLSSSTHDTKRSEDVRARLDVLSEMPDEWFRAVKRWHVLNRAKKTPVQGSMVPTRNEEYLFYQTMLGIWPSGRPDEAERSSLVQRLQAYMQKALKEAKQHTSWINPSDEHEQAVRRFIDRVLADRKPNRFLDNFHEFKEAVVRPGFLNALSQTVIKLTAPGVPDLYQGSELWDFSLVDPDNRRPVDFEQRRATLSSIERKAKQDRKGLVKELVTGITDGRIKQYLVYETLQHRRRNRELYDHGGYRPLRADGVKARHVVAFAREHGTAATITVAARFFTALGDARGQAWESTRLILDGGTPPGRYRDAYTGQQLVARKGAGSVGLDLARVFSHLPVALLVRVGES